LIYMTIINTQYVKHDRLGRITLEYLAQAKNLIVDFWNRAVGFFNSYQWSSLLFNLKLISLIISLFFLGLIIFLLIRINTRGRIQRAVIMSKSSHFKAVDKRMVKKWERIEKKLESESVDNYKLAILEADIFFENILQALGTANAVKISNLSEIEEAKDIKNKIVENKNFGISKEQANKIIAAYKKAIKEMGII